MSLSVIWAFFTAMAVTLFSIPSIVRVAELKHLYDYPGERKHHGGATPTLGGIAIFAGMIFSMTFWSDQNSIVELQYIIASLIVLFFMGIKDDIIELVAWKKLLGQLLAAAIIVHYTDIRIDNLFGFFGINNLPLWASYMISIFTFVVITNSFNLIDGINTLAGSIGLVVALTFGIWFLLFNSPQFAILAFALAGALLGFLWFNKTPAKIFMGDTGSLILGFTAAILAIQFIQTNRMLPRDADYKVLSVPVVAISILIIPLFDTLRVFLLRALKGRSPFSSDRTHIHHRLVDLGLTHMKATALLVAVNLFFIFSTYHLQGMPGELLLLYVIVMAVVFDLALFLISSRKSQLKGC